MTSRMPAYQHTAVIDYDGTLVENKWPEHGDWNPGAIASMKTLHDHGVKLVLDSARINPFDPYTSVEKNPADVVAEIQFIRERLNDAGLPFMDIWTLPGKPGASVYVDDKAERYHGRPGSWRALTEKILLRFGEEEALFPAFNQEVASGA